MAKKKAMVQPPPTKPEPGQTSFEFTDPALARILTQLGNDRAYTIVQTTGSGWVVMFEGDSQLSIVSAKDGNWHNTKFKK